MNPTTQTTTELKQNLDEGVRLLKQLAGEIRVELNLAGKDARDRWQALEPKLHLAERSAKGAGEASRKVVDEAIEAFKSFRKSLKPEAEKKV